MYTLKMKSMAYPAEKIEHNEEIRREVKRLGQKGYAVRVVDYPAKAIFPETRGLFRQSLEVWTEIPDLGQITRLGAETFFGTPCPNYIGVVFRDALWFSLRWTRGVGESEWANNVGHPWQITTHHDYRDGSQSFTWRLEADPVARTVEVSGAGMVNPDELFHFYEVLRAVERRLRIGRKTGQLIGLAKANNWEGVERLRREILDQAFTLP